MNRTPKIGRYVLQHCKLNMIREFKFILTVGGLVLLLELYLQRDLLFKKLKDLSAVSVEKDRLRLEEIRHKEAIANHHEHSLPSSDIFDILDAFHNKVALGDRTIVNSYDFKHIHDASGACKGKKVELLIGVITRTDSFQSRKAIRETWGQSGTVRNSKIVLLFFLGKTENKTIQHEINAEALKHGDIVQEDFVDSYRNLSLKSVALLKWVSQYCSESTFVLKADDDMYINIPVLLSKLRDQFTWSSLFIMGELRFNRSPYRNKKSKFYVSKEEYSLEMFPNFVSGTAYAMTTSAAMKLYVESLYVKNFFLEDVYLTGLVADRAAVPRVRDWGFSAQRIEPEGCSFKYRISGHELVPDELRKIHRELLDPGLTCS